jgi:hypothetical protein
MGLLQIVWKDLAALDLRKHADKDPFGPIEPRRINGKGRR